jgi:hypothetical protein
MRKSTVEHNNERQLPMGSRILREGYVRFRERERETCPRGQGACSLLHDLLASREIENIFENSDFIYMLNQAAGDRQILAKQLGISPHQLSYVTHSGAGEGLLFYGDVIIPFADRFPKDTELYVLLNTRPSESVSLPGNGV